MEYLWTGITRDLFSFEREWAIGENFLNGLVAKRFFCSELQMRENALAYFHKVKSLFTINTSLVMMPLLGKNFSSIIRRHSYSYIFI